MHFDGRCAQNGSDGLGCPAMLPKIGMNIRNIPIDIKVNKYRQG
jgi:hypothetical protein